MKPEIELETTKTLVEDEVYDKLKSHIDVCIQFNRRLNDDKGTFMRVDLFPRLLNYVCYEGCMLPTAPKPDIEKPFWKMLFLLESEYTDFEFDFTGIWFSFQYNGFFNMYIKKH